MAHGIHSDTGVYPFKRRPERNPLMGLFRERRDDREEVGSMWGCI